MYLKPGEGEAELRLAETNLIQGYARLSFLFGSKKS